MSSVLLERYLKEIAPKLQKELGLKNVMQVPRIEKVCINVGMGSYLQRLGTKDYSVVENTLRSITGQKPVIRHARMAVSNFKLREGMPVGASVTLRRDRAYQFLDKIINVVFPRVRGFQGVRRNIFDQNGNCSFGFAEHTVFPEISLDDTKRIHGIQVTVVTNSIDKLHTERLLEEMGFPFRTKVVASEPESVIKEEVVATVEVEEEVIIVSEEEIPTEKEEAKQSDNETKS